MAPVIRALAGTPALEPVVCVTDQHREMLDQVLEFFDIRPDHRLGVMRDGQSPSEVAARVLQRLPPVLVKVDPAAVLVQGDTTTTLAAALAAFYGGIPVGHIEAGLRTYRKEAPFPEEANRQMTTAISEWHFAPTAWARDNLLREGVPPEKVTVTGNPVIDALRCAAPCETSSIATRRWSSHTPSISTPGCRSPSSVSWMGTRGYTSCRRSTTGTWSTCSAAATSCSPTPAASRRRPPRSGNPCS